MTLIRARQLAERCAGPLRVLDERELERIPTHWLFRFSARPGVGTIMGGVQAAVYDRKTCQEETFGFGAEAVIAAMAAGLTCWRYDLVVTKVRDAPRAAELLAALDMLYVSTKPNDIPRTTRHDPTSILTALRKLRCIFPKQDLRPAYHELLTLRSSDALVHHLVPHPRDTRPLVQSLRRALFRI